MKFININGGDLKKLYIINKVFEEFENLHRSFNMRKKISIILNII